MKIRSVRPEFFADPTLADLSHAARILYIGLWCIADDDGRGEWLPKQIDGQIFPLETVNIHALLEQLVSSERVVRYTDGDRDYFYIPTFTKYQKPNRKYDSKLPDPEKCELLPAKSQESLFEQRVRSARTHAVEGEGVVEGEVAVALEFKDFHYRRAAAEFKKRGVQATNESAYIRTIAEDEDFLRTSNRLWAHRNCQRCAGKGTYNSDYAPGAGIRSIDCEEPQ